MSGSKVYQANEPYVQVTTDERLTTDELVVLLRAKEANPWWFMAIISAAKIMTVRREKYAGTNHPYYNFVAMAYRNHTKMFQVFRRFLHLGLVQVILSPLMLWSIYKFYLNLKMERLTISDKDYKDEKVTDTFTDIINYAAIALGWYLGSLTMDEVLTFEAWEAMND